MIKIKDVSMKFNLGIEKNNSLKSTIINIISLKNKKKSEDFWALKNITFNI